MKEIIITVFCILFMGCELESSSMRIDSLIYERINDGSLEIYASDYLPDFSTYFNLGFKLRHMIEYKVDIRDEFQSPEETFLNKSGDCEDFAILYINILYVKKGEKANLVLIEDSRTIIEGGNANHAVVQLSNGDLIEPQTGRRVDSDVKYSYSFDELFY